MSQSMTDEGTQSKTWVDFKLIKEAVTMEMVLVQYGIADVVRKGNEVRGACPFHNSKSKTSFSVNLEKNTFCCFAANCKARGNVLDFVAKMEDCTVRDAAIKLDELFNVTEQEKSRENGDQTAGHKVAVRESSAGESASGSKRNTNQTAVNAVSDATSKISEPVAKGKVAGESVDTDKKPLTELPDHADLVKKVAWLEKQIAVIENRLFYVEVEMASQNRIDESYFETCP